MRPLTTAHKRYRAEAEILDGEDEAFPQMQWVNCEACKGTGEVIKGPAGEPYNEHAELCPVCEGTGRDCE